MGMTMRAFALICSSFSRLTLLATVSLAAHATTVVHIPQSIEKSIGAADVVVHARVVATSKEFYQDNSKQRYCGANYEMEALSTFKGKLQRRFRFSSFDSPVALPFYDVSVGDQLLLLLNRDNENPAVDPGAIDGPWSSAEGVACLRKLATLRLSRADESGFLLVPRKSSSAEQLLWIAFARSRTVMPSVAAAKEMPYSEECEGESCQRDLRRMVPWPLVEGEIRRWLRETKPRR